MSWKGYLKTSSNIEIEGDDREPDLVYYNINIVNNNANNPSIGADPPIKFNETRSTPLIDDISKYNFSIVRFNLNGGGLNLPLFIPQIDITQSDINKTVYSLGFFLTKKFIGTGGATFTFTGYQSEVIEWTTQVTAYISSPPLASPLPNPPNNGNGQDLRTPYYYCYTYDHWCDLMNTTFKNAYAALQTSFNTFYTANGGTSGNTFTSQSPFIKYDPSNELFSIYYDVLGNYVTGSNPTGNFEQFTLYFNQNLEGLFGGAFPNNDVGDTPTGQPFELLVRNNLGTNYYTPPSGSGATGAFYVISQEYPSTSNLWSPVESIVFSSALMPVVPEAVGNPIVLGSSNNTGQLSNASNFQPIITDISLDLINASDYRQFISYLPTAEYRMSAMTTSKTALNNIDISVFWRNRLDNNLYPLTMYNLSSVSLKMLFRKRNL